MNGSRSFGAILLLLFFASEFAALLYQVVWQRLLTLITGLDLQATTTIVTAFMLGMGLGSLAGGHLADRLPARRSLILFAVAELLIAAFALASKAIYIDWLYASLSAEVSANAVAATACLTLLVPTFCMGLTLPLLAKAVTQRVEAAAGRIAGLYGWNTLGAAAGAWLGSAWVIRSFGYEQALWCGAGLNLASGVVVILLLLRGAAAAAAPAAAPSPATATPAAAPTENRPSVAPRAEGGSLSMRAWLLLYFLSGFMALGLEIVWFRLLGVILKSTSYTFALLLALYLLGVGAGSLIGRWLARRSRDPMRGFLRLQACIPLYAALSVVALTLALDHLDALSPAREYLGSSEPIAFAFDFGALTAGKRMFYLGMPAFLILPPTLLMGISFPFLQRAVQSDLGRLGRRVGWLQACNILGCTAGGAVVGLVLLDRLGTSGTLAALTLLGFVFAGLSVWQRAGRRIVRLALALAACLLAAWIVPAPAGLWASLHGTTTDRVIHAEDGSGLAVLRSDGADFRGRTTVYCNGLGQSWIPFGWVHTWLGLMPALLHPAPKTVAVIGLGSGDTVFALACRPETASVYAIEIMGKQLATLRELHERAPYGGIESLLTDRRFIHVHGDGRRFIMQGDRKFDIIEADALRPNSAYSGSLFSREYFELLRHNLAPGGFAVTWAPTPRTVHTFVSVFPHAVHVEPMLIGSNEPIAFDAEVVRARASSDPVRAWFARAGIDVVPMVDTLLERFRRAPQLAGPPEESLLNTDLFPRDELSAR